MGNGNFMNKKKFWVIGNFNDFIVVIIMFYWFLYNIVFFMFCKFLDRIK